MKKTALAVIGLALETYGKALDREQEVLMLATDILIDTFAAESAVLRALANGGAPLQQDAALVFVHDAVARVSGAATTALSAMATGPALGAALAAANRWLTLTPANTIAARRRIADKVIEKKGYAFA
jgi:hypothetical protein